MTELVFCNQTHWTYALTTKKWNISKRWWLQTNFCSQTNLGMMFTIMDDRSNFQGSASWFSKCTEDYAKTKINKCVVCSAITECIICNSNLQHHWCGPSSVFFRVGTDEQHSKLHYLRPWIPLNIFPVTVLPLIDLTSMLASQSECSKVEDRLLTGSVL